MNSAKLPLLLFGTVVRDARLARLKGLIADCKKIPTLAILQVGNLSESNAYIGRKKQFAEKIGAKVLHVKFSEKVTDDELIRKIGELNNNSEISGIILQLPIPKSLSKQKIIDAIYVSKDVDGLTSVNKKLFEMGDSRAVIPATARGVFSLLKAYKISVARKKVTVIGRSALVGSPIATLLEKEGAVVTVCHSKTENIPEKSRNADILIVAVGKPRFVTADFVSPGQVVVDVGINSAQSDTDGASFAEKLEEEIPAKIIVGDVDFEAVKNIVSAISPVPGGVGPMTVLSLFENLISAYEMQSAS